MLGKEPFPVPNWAVGRDSGYGKDSPAYFSVSSELLLCSNSNRKELGEVATCREHNNTRR